MALREREADFADGTVVGTSFTRRPDAIVGNLYALSFGPRAISDPSEGLLVKGWYIRADNEAGLVYLGEAENIVALGWRAERILFGFTGEDIACIDLTFDQNGAPVVVAERDSHVWLRWYRPGVGYVFEDLGVGSDARCILDDPINESESEVLVFYDRAGEIRYRVQSELYADEHDTDYVLASNEYLEGTLRDNAHRVHLLISVRDVADGTWTIERITSKLYPIPTDVDEATVRHRTVAGTIKLVILTPSMTTESLNLGNRAVSAALIPAVREEGVLDAFNLDVEVVAVDVVPLVQEYEAVDEADVSHRAISGTVTVVILLYAATTEELDVANRSISGTLVVP